MAPHTRTMTTTRLFSRDYACLRTERDALHFTLQFSHLQVGFLLMLRHDRHVMMQSFVCSLHLSFCVLHFRQLDGLRLQKSEQLIFTVECIWVSLLQ